MANQNWDWIFHTLGWTLAGLGLLLALWALFWDRSRGRKRCPKCWYSMDGAAADGDGASTCPECGRRIRRLRQLCKTRRRWRWLVVAALFIPLGIGGVVVPSIARDGWGALPTPLLIEALAWSKDASLRDALDARLVNTEPQPVANDGFISQYPRWFPDREWGRYAVSDRQWSRLAFRLSRMLGGPDSDASEWAVRSIGWRLPDPSRALPELGRQLGHGGLRARHDAARVIVLLMSDRAESNELQSQCVSCLPELVRLLNMQEGDPLLGPYPGLLEFDRSGWSQPLTHWPPEGVQVPGSVRSIVRADAAEAIGLIGIADDDAIAALNIAAQDSDTWVAHFARRAHQKIVLGK